MMNWLTKSDEYMKDLQKDLDGLIRIPSLRNDQEAAANAPFGKGCREALDYMLELGRKEGFQVEDIDGYAGVISYGEGTESIGVLGHLDIVPIGEGWTKEPLALSEENGVLYGRGVLDDKGPGMCAFYALKMLKDSGVKLGKKVMLIYGCDEESGMECMEYYVKHAEVPQMGFVPDADFPVIYGEKGGLHIELSGTCDTIIKEMHAGERANIVIGRASATISRWRTDALDLFDFYLQTHDLQGSVSFVGEDVEISIEGTFSHAAMPYNGVNAALHLMNFIGHTFDDSFAKATYAMLKDWQGKPLGIDIEGAYMGFLTMNTGIINIEDGRAQITIDIRYPNDADVSYIYGQFQAKIKEADYPLQAEIIKDSKPLFVDPNSELVTTLMDVYREYSKDTFTPAKTMGGGTYARKLPNFVAFGPEFPHATGTSEVEIGGPHQKNEGIRKEDLHKAMAIYASAIEKLAN